MENKKIEYKFGANKIATLVAEGKEIEMGNWKNKKNGRTYFIIGASINTTNDRNGQVMIEYRHSDEHSKYVRELNEFLEKFEKV